jgi:hypothetical protein
MGISLQFHKLDSLQWEKPHCKLSSSGASPRDLRKRLNYSARLTNNLNPIFNFQKNLVPGEFLLKPELAVEKARDNAISSCTQQYWPGSE